MTLGKAVSGRVPEHSGCLADDRIQPKVQAVANLIAHELKTAPRHVRFAIRGCGKLGGLGNDRGMVPIDIVAAGQIRLHSSHGVAIPRASLRGSYSSFGAGFSLPSWRI